MSSLSTQNFSLIQLLESIAHCIKKFFTQLFGKKQDPQTRHYQPANQNSGTSPIRQNTQTWTPAVMSHQRLKKAIQQIAQRDGFIWFYKAPENTLTAFLGNFYPCSMHIYSLVFKCSEAAFQSLKFIQELDDMRPFCQLDGDGAFLRAQQMTQNWTPEQHANWRNKNVREMREVVYRKFDQNPDLKELLLATGNAYLVEHTERDAFWGDGGNGTGQNMLGQILMEVRGRLGGAGIQPRPQNYNRFLAQNGNH